MAGVPWIATKHAISSWSKTNKHLPMYKGLTRWPWIRSWVSKTSKSGRDSTTRGSSYTIVNIYIECLGQSHLGSLVIFTVSVRPYEPRLFDSGSFSVIFEPSGSYHPFSHYSARFHELNLMFGSGSTSVHINYWVKSLWWQLEQGPIWSQEIIRLCICYC